MQKKQKRVSEIETMRNLAAICSEVTIICGAVALLIKPIRERVLGTRLTREGLKCLLRAEMLQTYYANKNERKIRQYCYENFIACYDAYKALGGNSFIDHIHHEVSDWEVIT